MSPGAEVRGAARRLVSVYIFDWSFVRPYANLPNYRWLVEDAQLAPCRPNLPKSGTLVEFAQLTEASSDMTNLDFRCSEIFIRVDSWKKYLSFELCPMTNDYLCK